MTISAAAAGPLWVRNWLLSFMFTQGLLADWQRDTELDRSVYRVAATMPVNGIQFDPGSIRYAPESRDRHLSPTHRSRWHEGRLLWPEAGWNTDHLVPKHLL
jgi:hypothetical protein